MQEAYRKALQENGDTRHKENVNNNIGEFKHKLEVGGGGGRGEAGQGQEVIRLISSKNQPRNKAY